MPRVTANIGSKIVALDARPDRLDFRDKLYSPRVCSLPPHYPKAEIIATGLNKYIANNMILDQGQEGACTGFGLAATINYLLFRHNIINGGDGNIAPVST